MKVFKIALCALMLAVTVGCNDQPVGYLEADNAVYVPNEMDVRLVLDEELDGYRISNVAPWVTPKMQGIIGTEPMRFEVASVTSEGGNAEMFQALLTVRGGGRMEFPLVSDITPGVYKISLRVSNEGYSALLPDVFTFVVK